MAFLLVTEILLWLLLKKGKTGEKNRMWIAVSNLYIVVYTEWGIIYSMYMLHTVTLWKKQFPSQAETQDCLTLSESIWEVGIYTNRPAHRYSTCCQQRGVWNSCVLGGPTFLWSSRLWQPARVSNSVGEQNAQKLTYVTVQLNRLLISCWSRVGLEVVWSAPTHCTAASQARCWLWFSLQVRMCCLV